jgi:hypothetical protein
MHLHLLTHSHHLAAALNPLIGESVRDTLMNLRVCLESLGQTLVEHYKDEAVGFLAITCAAALQYEAERVMHLGEADAPSESEV